MVKVVGTVLDIQAFLSCMETNIPVPKGQADFKLKKDRKYIIPDYQREIRWQKENLIELVLDLLKRDKFLGNIILNHKEPSGEYEIIDGQQRTTMLLMIIHYIKYRYNEQLDIFEVSQLKVDNFDMFNDFLESNFLIDENNPLYNNFKKSDKLNQMSKYTELWNVLCEGGYLKTKEQCRTILTNLKRSEVNIMVNTNDSDGYSIENFLDVNLKGVKLDDEDIFKGYLFSLDSGEKIRNLWNDLKSNVTSLETEKVQYPLMKILTHGLYCELYKDNSYKQNEKKLNLKENFTIGEEIEINDTKHYKGTHIVKIIDDKTYMEKLFENLNDAIKLMINIASSEKSTTFFKDKIKKAVGNVDDDIITIIHYFLRKILLDTNVIPKILVLKYILEIFIHKNSPSSNYKSTYTIFLLSTLFSIFENTKGIEKLRDVVGSKDWVKKALIHAKEYLGNNQISKSVIKAQYKKIKGQEDNQYKFRCKSLAVIYNFFELKEEHNQEILSIKSKQTKNLINFITDNDSYSCEHFIVNNSGKWTFNKEEPIKYPDQIKKNYKDSVLNFIFIDRQLNSDFLGNRHIIEKINMINSKKSEVYCEFSKMIIEMATKHFKVEEPKQELNKEELENYTEKKLQEDFSSYFSEVVKMIGHRLS